MVERKPFLRHRFSLRMTFATGLLLFTACATAAIPLSDYHKQIKQAATALNTLSYADETETETEFRGREIETVRQIRNLLPTKETVELSGGESFNVDNSWMHKEFDNYSAAAGGVRHEMRLRITERLAAIDERIGELEQAVVVDGSKADNNARLAEILKRPEYAHKVQQQNALTRLLERFLKWLRSWFPQPKPISPGSAGILSLIAQWFVIILALGVLAFVLKMILPRALRYRRPKKKQKQKEKARIVLGEKLEPDQSARDLLSEAEALARRGELRAAIRRAYIALLVELGERKVISLAQHKTNRDYLRAMRDLEPLYGNVKQMTDSFELHWYGLSEAYESDWRQFRSAYNEALK
jgi:hypothetical protein